VNDSHVYQSCRQSNNDSGGNGIAEENVSHLASFIHAFASLIYELDTSNNSAEPTSMNIDSTDRASDNTNNNNNSSTVNNNSTSVSDEWYVDGLENVVGIVFHAWPQLFPHQKKAQAQALHALFVALHHSNEHALNMLLNRIGMNDLNDNLQEKRHTIYVCMYVFICLFSISRANAHLCK
jgi:hypothetical protein